MSCLSVQEYTHQDRGQASEEGVVEKVYIPGAVSSAAENTKVAPVVSKQPQC